MQSIFTRLFQIKDKLDEHDYRKSEELLIADGIFAMGMGALCGGPFVSAFAIASGANNYEIGALITIVLLSQLIQLPEVTGFLFQQFQELYTILSRIHCSEIQLLRSKLGNFYTPHDF